MGIELGIPISPLQANSMKIKSKRIQLSNLQLGFILLIYDHPFDVWVWSSTPNLQPSCDVQLRLPIKNPLRTRKLQKTKEITWQDVCIAVSSFIHMSTKIKHDVYYNLDQIIHKQPQWWSNIKINKQIKL